MTKQADVLQDLKNVFNAALERNDLDALLKAFYPIEEIAIDDKDYQLLGKLYGLVAETMMVNDRTELLIRYCVKYLAMATSIPELKDYQEYYAIAAALDYVLDDHDMAMEHVLQEIALHEKLGNRRGIASRLTNVAELQLQKGRLSEALNTILDAKMILQELGSSNDVHAIINKSVIAKIYIGLGDFQRAKAYLDEILVWQDLDHHFNLKVELYANYAKYYEAIEDGERAIIYYKEAIEVAEDKQFDAELKELYITISKAYEKQEDYKNSHLYIKKYTTCVDADCNKKQSVLKMNAELELNLLQSEKKNKQLCKQLNLNHEIKGIDLLTGLFNEQYLMNMIDRMLRQNKASGMRFTLLLLKIPSIKEVHDVEGLAVMDELVGEVGNVLTQVKRRNHVIGRMSVDRFAVCMVDETIDQGLVTGQRYIDALMNHSPSILVYSGIVDGNKENAVDVGTLVRMADLALYQSEKLKGSQLIAW